MNINDSESQNIKNLLTNLGEKKNVLENDIEIMGDENAFQKFYIDKVKFIQSCIFTHFKNSLYKIKNNREIIKPYIPDEWNINRFDNMEDKYKNLIIKNNEFYKQYFSIYDNNKFLFDQMIKIIGT